MGAGAGRSCGFVFSRDVQTLEFRETEKSLTCESRQLIVCCEEAILCVKRAATCCGPSKVYVGRGNRNVEYESVDVELGKWNSECRI